MVSVLTLLVCVMEVSLEGRVSVVKTTAPVSTQGLPVIPSAQGQVLVVVDYVYATITLRHSESSVNSVW